MNETMTDLDALIVIGTARLTDHFAITRQAVYNWRTNGIPKQYRGPVKLLGESLGHDMNGFELAT